MGKTMTFAKKTAIYVPVITALSHIALACAYMLHTIDNLFKFEFLTETLNSLYQSGIIFTLFYIFRKNSSTFFRNITAFSIFSLSAPAIVYHIFPEHFQIIVGGDWEMSGKYIPTDPWAICDGITLAIFVIAACTQRRRIDPPPHRGRDRPQA
jgi:hypothetical protein